MIRDTGRNEWCLCCFAVPANAYLAFSSSNPGWERDRGYREVDGACNAIELPARGYFVRAVLREWLGM